MGSPSGKAEGPQCARHVELLILIYLGQPFAPDAAVPPIGSNCAARKPELRMDTGNSMHLHIIKVLRGADLDWLPQKTPWRTVLH